MKHHCVLYVFNTYARASFARNDKRLKLEEDGYVHEYKRSSNYIDVMLASGDILRLYYVAVNSIEDAWRQLAGHQFFAIHLQRDGLFTGEIAEFVWSRRQSKAPESEPVRRGELWQVISRG